MTQARPQGEMGDVPGASTADASPRPPYLWALGSGLGVFLLYAITLAPTTAFWDASEYIATAHILGIPHPPGNPLFVILARAWELLLTPTGLSTAVRVNLFSAFMGAGAAAFWFLVAHRILSYFTPIERVRRVGAVAAVLVSATAFTVWNQSNVNEKVYTVSLFTIALLTWLAFLWREHVEYHAAQMKGPVRVTAAERRTWQDDNVLVLMIFVLALSVGNHLMAFLVAPALLVFLLMVKPSVLANWRLYAWGIGFAALGLSVQMFLPIRAALDPIINEANPTCASLWEGFVSVITFGRAGCEDLSATLSRQQYAKPPLTERQAPFGAQFLNFIQYFDWQWARSVQGKIGYLAPARMVFTLLFAALGGYGAWRHWKRDRISFAYIATLVATLSIGLVIYLNFKYGWGQVQAWGMPLDVAEVRERDYFYLVAFSVWGLWAGIGIVALWISLMDRSASANRGMALKTSPVLALALIPLLLNWPYASRAGETAARDWAYNMLMSVEPYAILFTNGDNDTFPLWYLQEVEGIRRDVTVVVWSYFNTPWYAKQIRDLTTPCEEPGQALRDPTRITCQRPFEADAAPEIYAGASAPTQTALPLTDEQIDQITAAGYVQLPQQMTFQADGLQTEFPAGTVLMAADQFILTIIKESWGDRPVYFATTTGAHRNLGLYNFAVRQGVAYKLVDEIERAQYLRMPDDPRFGTIFGAYMDVDRTEFLLWDLYEYDGLLDVDVWVDDVTSSIPTYFGFAHLALAQAYQSLGETEKVDENVDQYEALMEVAER